MAAIKDRDDENKSRKLRKAKIKRGPGVFVYDGSLIDTEWVPQALRMGKNVAVLDANGMPVLDATGRQIFEKSGAPVRDEKGQPVLGGEPKVVKHPIEVYKLWGVEFPAGKEVVVDDPTLAAKLRGMDGFDEVEGAALEVVEEGTEKPAESEPRFFKKRGRPKKSETPAS